MFDWDYVLIDVGCDDITVNQLCTANMRVKFYLFCSMKAQRYFMNNF